MVPDHSRNACNHFRNGQRPFSGCRGHLPRRQQAPARERTAPVRKGAAHARKSLVLQWMHAVTCTEVAAPPRKSGGTSAEINSPAPEPGLPALNAAGLTRKRQNPPRDPALLRSSPSHSRQDSGAYESPPRASAEVRACSESMTLLCFAVRNTAGLPGRTNGEKTCRDAMASRAGVPAAERSPYACEPIHHGSDTPPS
jgi:hypothetical protein